MRIRFLHAAMGLAASALSPPLVLTAQVPADPKWQEVARTLQTSPVDGGGYVRYNLPRADLHVRVAGIDVAPSLALTSWAGFAGSPGRATVMGDLVVAAAELGPVLAELARREIDVTAIHDHLVAELPPVTYVHFHAAGDAVDIARRLDAVLRLTATPRPVSPPSLTTVTIDSALIFGTLGKRGRASGAVVQLAFLLVSDTVTMAGERLVPALAYASPVNFQAVDLNRVVATGDFAVTGSRLQPLLKTLAASGITATAVHGHLVGEAPRVYYVHFWGDGPLPTVLRGLRSAIDAAR